MGWYEDLMEERSKRREKAPVGTTTAEGRATPPFPLSTPLGSQLYPGKGPGGAIRGQRYGLGETTYTARAGKELLADPIFWMAEKVNRGQQAIFGFAKGVLEEQDVGIGLEYGRQAVYEGRKYQAVELLDAMGLQGQAGHFDWIDPIAVVLELGADPANYIGIGALGKLGKVGKGFKAAGKLPYAAAAKGLDVPLIAQMTKGMKAGETLQLAAKALPEAGELGGRVLSHMESLQPPPAYSHYLYMKQPFGPRHGIPYSNVLLENAFIKPGKWMRKKFSGILSTTPEDTVELMERASREVAQRQAFGTGMIVKEMGKSLTKSVKRGDFTDESLKYLDNVGEGGLDRFMGNIVEGRLPIPPGTPAKVAQAIEVGKFYDNAVPKLENLSGIATTELLNTSLVDNVAEGLGTTGDEAVGFIKHIINKDVLAYKTANDIRYMKKYGVGRAKPYTSSNLARQMRGTLSSINERMADVGDFTFHPKGQLLGMWSKGDKAARALFEDTSRMLLKDMPDDKLAANLAEVGRRAGTEGKDTLALFKDAAHYQKYDQFFMEDFWGALSMRVSQSARARTLAETLHVAASFPDDAATGAKIAIKIAKGTEEGYPGFRMLTIPKSTRQHLTKDLLDELDSTLFLNEAADMLEKGPLVMWKGDKISEPLKWWRKGISYYRAGTILPFGGYHVANKAGNQWWRFINGTANPRNDWIGQQLWMKWKFKGLDPADAAKPIKGPFGKTYQVDGKTWTQGDVYAEAITGNVMAAGQITAELATEPGKVGFLNKVPRWFDMINPASRKQAGAYVAKWMEEGDRLSDYIGRRLLGDSVEQASRNTNIHLFDYGDITKTEQGIRDITMFMTWYRKNLGLTMQKMWEYPGRLSYPAKIRNMLDGAFGQPDSEYATPTYLLERVNYYLGKDKEKGKPVTLDPEKYLPPLSAGELLSDIINTAAIPFGGKPKLEAFGQLVPPIKAYIELGLGKEAFSGRETEGVEGELRPFLGGHVTPRTLYLAKNVRLLNTINRILWPQSGEYKERLEAGEKGKRPAKAFYEAGKREWAGIKLQTTDPQKNRYFKGLSINSDLNKALGANRSKLSGDPSPVQRESLLKARSDLLYEKAQVIAEMIEDGTNAFTGEKMKWVADPAVQGEEDKGSLRELHNQLFATLRDLYFGDVKQRTDHGIIVMNPQPRISPQEVKQVYETMNRLVVDTLNKDAEYAVRNRKGDFYKTNVLGKIRELVRTEEFYSKRRRLIRKGKMPEGDITLYNYPYPFRKALSDSFVQHLVTGAKAGLYSGDSAESMLEYYILNYGLDYRE